MIAQQMANAARAPAPTRPGAPPAKARPGHGDSNPGVDFAVRIMMAAMKIIYSKPQSFIDMIRNAPTPQQGIVQAVDLILKMIAQSAKGVPPDQIKRAFPIVGQRLGPMIGKLLFELASAAGIMKQGGGVRPAQPGAVAQPPAVA